MATIGLYFYGARFYDPVLSRFTSADSIIPGAGDVQAWDRYAAMGNNPVRYTDPTGHAQACADGDEGGGCGSGANEEQIFKTFDKEHGGMYEGAFAEYYAMRHSVTIASSRGDPNLDAYIASAESAYQYALAYVPQKDFDPSLVIAPYSAYQFANAAVSIGKDIIGTTSWAFIPNPRGINGNPDHQATVAKLTDLAQSEFPGSEYKFNVSIKDQLGIDRRPDVTVWDRGNLQKVYEAGRVDKFGNFVPREQIKMYEYYEAGIPYYFLPVK